nr:MAG TPA: hypothetical protein [Caudoviricetes sp.]
MGSCALTAKSCRSVFRAAFLIPRACKAPPGSFYTLPILQIPRP